jgi:hypothetical protein
MIIMNQDPIIVNRVSLDLSPFASARRKLEVDPKAWIEAGYLLAEIKRNAHEPIPEVVLDHLINRLNGKAKKRRGRGRIFPEQTIGDSVRDLSAFALAKYKLEADPKAWIETSYLLAELTRIACEPLPESILDHLSNRLDGKARKRKGRGRISAARKVRDSLIWARFERLEAWLIARQKKRGLIGWQAIRNAEWWKGPPSERAARMVNERLGPNIEWERVRNIAYRIRKDGVPPL